MWILLKINNLRRFLCLHRIDFILKSIICINKRLLSKVNVPCIYFTVHLNNILFILITQPTSHAIWPLKPKSSFNLIFSSYYSVHYDSIIHSFTPQQSLCEALTWPLALHSNLDKHWRYQVISSLSVGKAHSKLLYCSRNIWFICVKDKYSCVVGGWVRENCEFHSQLRHGLQNRNSFQISMHSVTFQALTCYWAKLKETS